MKELTSSCALSFFLSLSGVYNGCDSVCVVGGGGGGGGGRGDRGGKERDGRTGKKKCVHSSEHVLKLQRGN